MRAVRALIDPTEAAIVDKAVIDEHLTLGNNAQPWPLG